MKNFLIVHHSPSDNTRRLVSVMAEAAEDMSSAQSLTVTTIEALQCQPEHVLQADALLLMTPENLGYMSGGMKDFFDRIYYPCLEEKQGLPVSALIRAGTDGTGTHRALMSITTGLKWRWVQEAIILRGDWQPEFLNKADELAGAMACALDQGII